MLRKRQLIFLTDVIWFTLTAFGGAQAHIGMMLKNFVKKRQYISENELLELNALTQILPGPSSTQTLIGIAYKVGGLPIAISAFIIWILPSAVLMCLAVLSYTLLGQKEKFTQVLHYVQPVAVGIVAYAAYSFGEKVLKSKTSFWLAAGSLFATLLLRNAYAFPILILIGGIVSSSINKEVEENNLRVRLFSNINPKKIAYFIGVLLLFAGLGALINRTSPFSLPIRLFENFYRNGIMIFGGGQVLVPFMYTEFVEMKSYLSSDQFLSGYAFQQALPGPTFSFTSFVGGMTMKNSGASIYGQIMGSIIAVLGINLPGLILILFIVPFWNDLKKITRIKNSLSGINAVSVGFMGAAFLLLIHPVGINYLSVGLIISTFILLAFTKIRTPVIILATVLLGLFL
ncbi:MAG: chromate transporter [Sphingobacteriales bacterium 17-39-43]|uniref:chromate efflux transporter n=1 Tax=Daejeonella sp. TaxID=2805397 RepID=UPI000BD26742|nr:chromate efflux transporter [Daejeonella sp.]OYZ33065.1 MAG: chromate transporter [Sphingobacteriales bacterium 16-39-50]OZA26474.1 MAG: chromate transporter [Sphingobacteriales bacterium 17-39-43]HQT21615.1 chromate efflux transporter [Daejeonella sp.]HQT56346.1 chromate efflux transporter [Daejeonella sp.]